jgi:hypothetical protein
MLIDVPCQLKSTPLGCFVESTSARALGVELQNEVDPVSKVFRGNVLDIKEWDAQFPGFLCRCARAAGEKGFSVFGVYNNGEKIIYFIFNHSVGRSFGRSVGRLVGIQSGGIQSSGQSGRSVGLLTGWSVNRSAF